MKIKRITCLILAALLIIATLGACKDKKGNDGSTQDGSHVSADVFSKEKVEYKDADGDSKYNIVRPAEADSVISGLATDLFKRIKTKIGVSPKNIADDAADGTDSYEILIGDTNRAESRQASDYFNENYKCYSGSYFICTIGKKIVILGVGDKGITDAVNYFCDNFVKPDGIDGGLLYGYDTVGDFTEMTIDGTNIKNFKIVRQHFNGSYLTQTQMEELAKAVTEKSGYELKIVDDVYTDAGDYEIIVGNTNRGGQDSLGRNEYSIAIDGKKVVLNGGSYHATALAVTEFKNMLTAKGSVTSADSVKKGDYNETLKGYDKSTYFTPKWYDEFEGDMVDNLKWRIVSGSERSAEGYNNKRSVRSADPAVTGVNDGKFYIQAAQDELYYYGGMITTDSTMSYLYGIIEISALLPEGPGFWTSLWQHGHANEPDSLLTAEIDINECFGNSSVVAANCHAWPTSLGKEHGLEHTSLDESYKNDKKYYCPDSGKFGDTFHTYGMLWDSTQMSFFCDGKIYFSYDITQKQEDIITFNKKMYLILSAAIGFKSSGYNISNATDEQWANTSKLLVDNLYIYQMDDGKSEIYLR